MRVTVTNLSLNPLSTDIGLIQVGGSTTVANVSSETAYKLSLALKTLVDAGRATVAIADEADRLDLLEPVTVGAEGSIQSLVTLVSSAELLALNATPKTLVAAPGANKALIFEGATLYMPYNSAAYAGIAAGEDFAFKYTGTAGLALGGCEATGFIDQVASGVRYTSCFGVVAASLVSDITPVANAPIVLHMLVGEVTTGNSPLYVKTYYRVVPTVLA